MIGKRISHYEIQEKLGEGGMGVVYKAQDTKLNRTVALKFLPQDLTRDQDAIDRFINEAQAASSLDHANICTIYEIGETEEGQMFIAMAYYAGGTLQGKIANGKLHIAEAIDVAMQVARGLERAHEAGITHRDIKPSNLIITPRGEVKIIDFGLAKLSGQNRLTKTGATVGTVAYMSPEQLQGQPVDHRTDIWSLGVVFYEMLTGKLPFQGDYEAAMIYFVINEKPDSAQKYRSELSLEFLHVLDRALEKKSTDRYQSVSDMLNDLHQLKQEPKKDKILETLHSAIGEKKISEVPASVQAPRPSRKKMWIGLGAAVILVVVITALLSIRQRSAKLNPEAIFRTLPVPFAETSLPGLSRDGSWVAFGAADAQGKWEVYLMNTSGGEPRRVTSSDAILDRIISADISPDGSRIVYMQFNIETQKFEIRTVSSLGGLSKRIVERGYHPLWRADGQRIGYILIYSTKSGKREFWSVKPDGSENRLEFVDSAGAEEGGISFSWSPDGKSVAWVRRLPEHQDEIVVRELANDREQRLTLEQKSIGNIFWTHSNAIIFSLTKSGNDNLWMIPVVGGKSMPITQGAADADGPQLSADGKKLLYHRWENNGYLWIANCDGSGASQVTFDERWLAGPILSPDGRRLLFNVYDLGQSNRWHLYLMDRDGSNRQQLTFGDERVVDYEWSPDGQWIAYSSTLGSFDSASVYLLPASNPVAPRLLGRGWGIRWYNSNILLVWRQFKNWILSLDGKPPERFYADSTSFFPFPKEKYALFEDYRMGREGWWIVPFSDLTTPATALPKKILPKVPVSVAPSGKFLLYYMPDRGEYRKLSLPDGKDEISPVQLSGLTLFDAHVSHDGKEIAYTQLRLKGRLVIIENPFK